MTELRSLVSGLAHSTDIRLELGNHWAWNTRDRIVYVPASDLHDLPRCRAISAHEVGHVLYTRPLDSLREAVVSSKENLDVDSSQPKKGCTALWHMMLNALEDPRVEVGIGRRYPGASAWLRALHVKERSEDQGLSNRLPLPILFFQAHLREYHQDWIPLVSSLGRESRPADSVNDGLKGEGSHSQSHSQSLWSRLPAPVLRALDGTRTVRRNISLLLPDSMPLSTYSAAELGEAYATEVLPRVPEFVSAGAAEAGAAEAGAAEAAEKGASKSLVSSLRFPDDELRTQLAMARMLSLSEQSIWPVVCALYRMDLIRLQVHLNQCSMSDSVIEQLLESHPGEVLKEAFSDPYSETHAETVIEQRTVKLLERWYEHQSSCKKLDWNQLLCGVRIGPNGGQDADNLSQTYAQLKREIHPQIRALTERLADAIRPQQRFGWAQGYTSGTKVNVRRMLQASARNQGELDFWQRRTEHSKRSAVATLLIDLSGSMHGEKSLAALRAAVLFVEALAPMGIPTSVKGFKRSVVSIKEFDDPLGTASRERIAGMLKQVGSVNNDAKAVREAAHELSKVSADDRVLIVISDGEPVGSGGPASLRAALREWEPRISIAGLGIGPGTGHVTRYYSFGKGNIPLEQLSGEIGMVLNQALQR